MTPSQVLQNQKKELRKRFSNLGTVRDQDYSWGHIVDAMENSYSSLLRCLEEWAKEQRKQVKYPDGYENIEEEAYNEALDDLLEFMKQ